MIAILVDKNLSDYIYKKDPSLLIANNNNKALALIKLSLEDRPLL
jgi:hypothetical protein